MTDAPLAENDFIGQVNAVIERHMGHEQFGVSELADQLHMSRSSLLRKVKKETKLSVSQLINQARLKAAMEMLRKSSLNVSEVSDKVGFNSTSYFIKCFREYYGYPPGEVGKRDLAEVVVEGTGPLPGDVRGRKSWMIWGSAAVILAAIAASLLYFYQPDALPGSAMERSIIVLPFKNDSNDSTNLYLINGLMESTLNNLQKIKDLKVISRTSAEKYRMTDKSIPEMARELDVNYFVEGSGQKIGDQILLNIQLIEGPSDKHLWSRQYRREVKDIFALQQEIAKDIAEEIRAIITPEEAERIDKIPTADLLAYDDFLKGQDLLKNGKLEDALPYFQKAVDRDNHFAVGYAEMAVTYYYLDMFQKEKKYTAELNTCADKAMLLDPTLSVSLVAKALYYMHEGQYQAALPYLEKAMEYHPNSLLVINFLSEMYNNFVPNTAKYLEYALKGVRLDASDSISMSNNYLHLSNAFIQSGFVEEASVNIKKSLAYYPDNFYARWVNSFIVFAKNKDINETRNLLLKELRRDTSNIPMLEEVAKVYFLMRNYDSAYVYYNKFLYHQERLQLDLFKHEYLRIAIVLAKKGQKEKSEALLKSFKDFADNNHTIYKPLFLSSYYANQGDTQKAIDYMKLFAKEDNYQYWILLLRTDPEADPIRNHPDFTPTMDVIEAKFWKKNKEIRRSLVEKGVL